MSSFSTSVKNEIAKNEQTITEKTSELSAILRCNYEKSKELSIKTENAALARRVFTFFKDLFNERPSVSVTKAVKFSKKNLYTIKIENQKEKILKTLSLMSEERTFLEIPHEYLISSEDDKRAYLRGVFLSVGSINDPKFSRYHLEFFLKDKKHADLVKDLLNDFELNSKVIKREKGYMVYIKEAAKIGDFLRLIGGVKALLYYEDIRIYRDNKNMNNRLNNCDQANMEKVINTAQEQLRYIKKIKEMGAFNLLDEKLKEVVFYREKYQEASLLELSIIITKETNKKIGKSGLNHRFRKIKEIAEKL